MEYPNMAKQLLPQGMPGLHRMHTQTEVSVKMNLPDHSKKDQSCMITLKNPHTKFEINLQIEQNTSSQKSQSLQKPDLFSKMKAASVLKARNRRESRAVEAPARFQKRNRRNRRDVVDAGA